MSFAGRRRPSLAAMLLVAAGVGWSAIQVVRVVLYFTHHPGADHPLLMVANAVLGMTFGLSVTAVIVGRATGRIVAALARSESDRDLILAGVHDRIDTAEATSQAALDRSMNWVLRRITHE